MTNEFDNLEREVEGQLAELAGALDVPPTHEIAERARLAVRVALDEQLLARIASPTPSPQAVASVRGAVRGALNHRHGYRWWMGPLAAAAALALAVGVSQRFGQQPANDPIDTTSQPEHGVVFTAYVEATDDLLAPTELTASLQADLVELEQTISTWNSTWGELDDALDAIESNLQKQSLTDDTHEGKFT